MQGEGALVGEAELQGQFAAAEAGLTERLARGLDAGLQLEALGADAEGLFEAPVEVANGESDVTGEVGHVDGFAEMFADVGDGFFRYDNKVCRGDAFS